MSSTPANNRARETSQTQPEPDESPLTPDQLAFAKVVGQRMAERWAQLHASQQPERAAQKQVP